MPDKMMLTPDVEYIINTLFEAGYRADVVGGAVRDHLLGRPSYDYDITTSATPDEVKGVFSKNRIVDTGIKHGTVTLVLDGGTYEITTWRIDGDYLDNRHPESVSFTRSLEEDLARRDFTVNAICYNPRDGYTDLYGGMSDIGSGVIRAVGEPSRRFREDALRIMRAVRFSATLGFKLDAETAKAAAALKELLLNVSEERIYTELKKLISAPSCYDTLSHYGDVILTVLPELKSLKLPDAADFAEAGYTARLLSIFYLNSKDPSADYTSAMQRLKTDSDQRIIGDRALQLLKLLKPCDTYSALKLLSAYGEREARLALELGVLLGVYDKAACEAVESALRSGLPYRVAGLAVDGKDMMKLGFSGKAVGDMLSRLLELVMLGECENDFAALTSCAEKLK